VTALPPAGWHEDPEDSRQWRYWDGSQWTEHRSPRVADPDAAPPGASVPHAKSQAQLAAEAKRLADINAHAAKVRQKTQAKKERSIGGLPLMDHLRVWQFETSLSPADCLGAFEQGLASSGLMRGKWSVEVQGDRAVATYAGRRGFGALGSMMSETSEAEEARAAGTRLVFAVVAGEDTTRCTMQLAQRSTRLGFTNDARFIRPSMRAVGSRLRTLDPQCSQTFSD
jgi:hypothetical protein